ncbi:MAG: galactokinase [Spirochaetota bacterium]
MKHLFSLHRTEYGIDPEVVVSAPGSVNLMGEHTDYNEGFVLQAAISRSIMVAMSRRKDNSLRFFAADYNERKRTTITNLKYKREDRWANYAKGVLYELNQLGHSFKGIDITIKGDIPQGIGLAASSALCIAATVAAGHLFNLKLSDDQIIRSSTRAETTFIGLDKEITDQIVACTAKKGNIIFLDLRTEQYEYIPLKLNGVKILITVSNVPLVSFDAELKERKEDCKKCVEYLRKKKPGTALRDYTIHELTHSMGVVPENIRRRCLHVVEENQRVLDAKTAILEGDLVAYGKLLNRSHESLRDNYEVSCPELDWLVKRAWELDGVLGSRMTGAGFGGCTITLIKDQAIEAYNDRLEEYERIFGFDAETIICDPAQGVHVLYP